jgi:hypothetical protein
MENLEDGVFLIKGKELSKRLRESYDQGYADGYSKAITKPNDKKGNVNELEIGEQTE